MRNMLKPDQASFLSRELLGWKGIFAYRNLWMALSMAVIILYHAPYVPLVSRVPVLSTVFHYVRLYGYGGVDVFLFSSGIGCYFSLKKDPDILRFLQRRAQRILPVFLMSLIIWTVYRCMVSTMTLSQFIGNLFGHGTLASQDNQLNWYYGCLWVCYFFSPFFAALVQAYPSVWVQGLAAVLLSLCSVPFWGQWPLILWSRIPVFFLGICMGQAGSRRDSLTWGGFLLMLAGLAVGIGSLSWLYANRQDWLWDCGGWWYPFILITPAICVLLSLLASLLEKTPVRILVKWTLDAGKYTLPLSLTHVIVFSAYQELRARGLLSDGWAAFLVSLILTVLSAACLQAADGLLQRCCRQSRGRRG